MKFLGFKSFMALTSEWTFSINCSFFQGIYSIPFAFVIDCINPVSYSESLRSRLLLMTRNNFVSIVCCNLKAATGERAKLKMMNRESYKPPISPSQSRMLYVWRWNFLRFMLALIQTLANLKRELGSSSVGQFNQELGLGLDIENEQYSLQSSCPYQSQSVSSSSSFCCISQLTQDGLQLSIQTV